MRLGTPLGSALLLALACLASAEESRTLRLSELRVVPDSPSLRSAVVRDLALVPGESLDAARLSEIEARLRSSGHYAKLFVYAEPGAALGEIVLVVEAELDRSAHLVTGFGHAPLSGWYLDLLGARWDNAFRRGDEIRFGYRLGQRRAGFVSELHLPRTLGAVDLHAELTGLTERWRMHEDESVFEQDIRRSELRLGLGLGYGGPFSGTLWFGGGGVDPEEHIEALENASDESAGRLVPIVDGKQEFGSLGFDLRLDQRPPGAWRFGHEHELSLRLIKETAESFGHFEAASSWATPLPGGSALALRARGAAVGWTAPYYHRLQFGGTGSVRGFRDASLSGPLGSRAYWLTSAEWRAPILPRGGEQPRVIGVLFADVGQQWDSEGERADPALGVGYGVRVRMPWIQIFALDIGIPLTEDTTGDAFWAHTSLGFGF